MTSQKNTTEASKALVCGFGGIAIGTAVAAALLFAFTAIAYSTKDPSSLTAPLGYTALYLTAAVSGIAASRLSGESGAMSAISGAVSGAALLAILIVMSFIPAEAAKTPLAPVTTVLMYASLPVTSATAGFFLRRKYTKKRRRRRRR